MSRSVKPTIGAPIAIFLPNFTLRAAMSVDTIHIIALGPEMAGRHPRHSLQNDTLILGQFMAVGVVTVKVGAVAE